MTAHWSDAAARGVHTRIVVEADLVLLTPAHLGGGDSDDLSDMSLLLDPRDPRLPLLPGTSIAGALRGYLLAREFGTGGVLLPPAAEESAKLRQNRLAASMAARLLGGDKGDDAGAQSPLIVDDGRGQGAGVTARAGVKLDPRTRTAETGKLFDIQLWEAGTRFPLHFELLLREDGQAEREALATALLGLQSGAITLGARRRRGYGRVQVERWRVREFALDTTCGLCDWLVAGDAPLGAEYEVTDLQTELRALAIMPDRRAGFRLTGRFALQGSLLIRSGEGADDKGPDMVHLHARQADGSRQPVLSGTSLGGALRARAGMIARSIDPKRGAQLVNAMFGPELMAGVKPRASKVTVAETQVRGGEANLVQNRVSIDRFTGGARHNALFNQQPLFAAGGAEVEIDLHLANPTDAEIGLLLLVLKDLWTGDLPLGGESSVGRGRLQGWQVNLRHQTDADLRGEWHLDASGDGQLTAIADAQKLEEYVAALHRYLRGEAK